MKKNSLFCCISLILSLLIVLVAFAGCKGSSEDVDNTSSNGSLSQNDTDLTLNVDNQENTDGDESNSTTSNGTSVNSNKQNNSSTNGDADIQDGQDVVIDFGEDDDVDINTSGNNNNTTDDKTENGQTNNTNTSSGDGWTGDYIIK